MLTIQKIIPSSNSSYSSYKILFINLFGITGTQGTGTNLAHNFSEKCRHHDMAKPPTFTDSPLLCNNDNFICWPEQHVGINIKILVHKYFISIGDKVHKTGLISDRPPARLKVSSEYFQFLNLVPGGESRL